MATRNISISKDTWTEVAGDGESVDIQNRTTGSVMELAWSSGKPSVVGFVITDSYPKALTGKTGEKIWARASEDIEVTVQ